MEVLTFNIYLLINTISNIDIVQLYVKCLVLRNILLKFLFVLFVS